MNINRHFDRKKSLRSMIECVEEQGQLVTEKSIYEIFDLSNEITDPNRFEFLGIQMIGKYPCVVLVTDPTKPIGNVKINCQEPSCFFVADNVNSGGRANITIRMNKAGSSAFFAGIDHRVLNIRDVFMRSEDQWLFWGAGATAVSTSLEIEGEGRGMAIGDDCMFSSETRIRNHDMHTLFDYDSNRIINTDPVDTVVQQHVWIGEGVTVLSSPLIGFGSVAGARTLIKGTVPPMSVAVGVPHKIQREGVSWCRSVRGIAPSTTDRLNRLMSFKDSQPPPC